MKEIKMKTIAVVCAYCMSAGLLIKKMEPFARERDVTIRMVPVRYSQFRDDIVQADLVLIEPALSYLNTKIEKTVKSGPQPAIPVASIDSHDYATLQGEKVFNFAWDLLEGKAR